MTGECSIVDLYSDWKKNSKSKLQTTFDALKTFAKAKGSTIFSGTYDYFVEEILAGRLIPGVSAYHAWDRLRDLNTSHMSYDEKGTCYPFGADIVWFPLDFSNDYSFDGKELVIRNDNPKDSYLHTNIYTRYNVRKTIPYETILWPGDSLVIPADSLNNLLKAQRRTSGFYTVTSSYDESGKRSSNIKVEIRDIKPTIKPTEMSFEAEGGTQEAKVTAPGYSYFGVRVDEAYSNWLSATPTKGGKVTVTAKANSTSEPRTGYVKCYVARSAAAPESEWVWLTPIKVTQKAGNGGTEGNEGNEGNEGKEGWWLVETKIDKAEDTTNDNGHFIDYMNYTASETGQSMTGMQTGLKGYEYVQQPVSFVSTIQAPPAWIGGGETLLLHFTVKRTSPAAYCYVPVGPVMYWGNAQVAKINVVGGTSVATRENDPSEGEWDFELQISKGSKNSEKEIKLVDACRSTIHWIYRWGNSSAK